MSVAVKIGLLSGRTVSLEASLDETVGSVKRRAQNALAVGQGQLADPSGNILDVSATVKRARWQSDDFLTVHIGQTRLQRNRHTFAAIIGDGSVVTWGRDDCGGDSSVVRDQLQNVQQIQASHKAFAAVRGDRSVVSWGRASWGGDSGAVQHQLKKVCCIQATRSAFAALLEDGSVVTWGSAPCGGDSRAVQGELKNVRHIQAHFLLSVLFAQMAPS